MFYADAALVASEMASSGFSRDDQVLEAIFNPENPVGGLDVSKQCYIFDMAYVNYIYSCLEQIFEGYSPGVN